MAIKNTSLGGTDWVSPARIKPTDLNDTFDEVESRIQTNDDKLDGTTINDSVINPVGSLISWMKTFATLSSGSANSNVENELVNTSATFISDGVVSGSIVYNSTDDTFAIVDSVDSETTITLKADSQAGSSTIDIFPLGTESYIIYATQELPEYYIECNGQTLSDSDSVYNGQTIPDLNGDNRFLRGSNTSGATGGSETHTHSVNIEGDTYGSSSLNRIDIESTTGATSTLPTYYEVVWIMRIK